MADLDKLFGTTDARTWALEFIDVLDHDENINPKDLGFLIGWFANAIETGRIAGVEEERQRPIMEKIHEVLYQVAGAATAPLLQACPDLIFPSEEVADA